MRLATIGVLVIVFGCGDPAAAESELSGLEEAALTSHEVAVFDDELLLFAAEVEQAEERLMSGCQDDEDCLGRVHGDALVEAVAIRASPMGREGSTLGLAVDRLGFAPVREYMVTRYQEATSSTDRLASLQLLLYTKKLDPARMPDDAFGRFFEDDASQMERTTLLELHRVTGVSQTVAVELADWCVLATTSRSNRLHCLAALGHATSPSELTHVFDVLAAVHTTRSLAMRIGDAVGRCGRACNSLMARLVTSERVWDRQASYFAAARGADQVLRDTLRDRLDVTRITSGEEAYVERALGLDWRELIEGVVR